VLPGLSFFSNPRLLRDTYTPVSRPCHARVASRIDFLYENKIRRVQSFSLNICICIIPDSEADTQLSHPHDSDVADSYLRFPLAYVFVVTWLTHIYSPLIYICLSPYLFVSIRHVLHVSIRHVLHVGRPYLFDKQICRHIYSYLFVMSCTSEGHGSSDDVALSCRYVVTWLVHIYSSLIHICSSCLPTSIGRGSSDFVAHSYQYVVTWRIHIYYSLIHICSSCLQRR